jgi:tRNA A-37 threonylcarbamoyl transferase component Bud32
MPSDNANWVGQLLSGGRYQVTAALGAGGMGLVYRARDTQLGREVVIKVPRRSMLADPGFASRFDRESRWLANLSHPHIVKVHDVGNHDDRPFVVLEYLPGGSLRDRLRRDARGEQTPRPPEELASWLEWVAAALDFIHKQGFVHRDVKPDNILFDAEGHVFLSDFGIVKALTAGGESAEQSVLTGTGLIIGTPRYLAPELILGQPYDGRADQYALAATVYETLCGRVPVDGPTSAAIVLRLKSQPIAPIHTVVASLPATLGEALQRGLAKNPRDRYADCASFARAVVAAATGPAAPAPPAPKSKAVTACPGCGKKFTVVASALGKRVRCPQCGEVVQTDLPPAFTPVPATPRVPPPAGALTLAETVSDPGAAAPPRKRTAACCLLSAVGLVGVATVAMAAGWFAVYGGAWPEWLPTPAVGGNTVRTTVSSVSPSTPTGTSKGSLLPTFAAPPPTHTSTTKSSPPLTTSAPRDTKMSGGAAAKAGDWEPVGQAGAWKGTLAGAVLNESLYTVDSDGHLYHSFLRTGNRKQVGSAAFGNTAFMFAAGRQLYTIEKNGTLYRVNARDGSWARQEGDWKETRACAVIENRLFTIEKSGTLYGTDLATTTWVTIGKPNHAATAFLFATDYTLYAIEKEGSLFRINPKDGGRQRVGQAGNWKGTVAGAVLGDDLYTVEASGHLYKTTLPGGSWVAVGKPEFGSTAFLFAAGDKLYSIEKDGALYRVNIK